MPDYAIIDDPEDTDLTTVYDLEDSETVDVYELDDGDLGKEFYEELKGYTSVLVPDDLDSDIVDEIQDNGVATLEQADARDASLQAVYDELAQAPYREQAARLEETVKDKDSWAIMLHNNPDPDAMSAAMAFQQLLDANGAEGEIYHRGEINHHQNKVMVNKLDGLDLKRVDEEGDLPDPEEYEGIAMLDTNPSSTGLIGDREDQIDLDDVFIDVLIDHHENWEDMEAYQDSDQGFIDIRTDRGSTASIMSDYLDMLDIDYEGEPATALLVGIMTDTDHLNPEQNFSGDDIEAVPRLYEQVTDRDELASIWEPDITEEFLDLWAEGIKNREKDGSVVYSYLGDVDEPNAISSVADVLLKLEAVDTAITYGKEETDEGSEQIRISGRNKNAKINLGDALKTRFGGGGDVLGGAGAQVPINEDVFQGIADKYYDAEEDGRKQVYLDAILESIKQDLEDLDKETS